MSEAAPLLCDVCPFFPPCHIGEDVDDDHCWNSLRDRGLPLVRPVPQPEPELKPTREPKQKRDGRSASRPGSRRYPDDPDDPRPALSEGKAAYQRWRYRQSKKRDGEPTTATKEPRPRLTDEERKARKNARERRWRDENRDEHNARRRAERAAKAEREGREFKPHGPRESLTDEERKARHCARNRARYAADPETYREAARTYSREHREKANARAARYAAAHPDRVKESKRRYREAHKEQEAARARARYHALRNAVTIGAS